MRAPVADPHTRSRLGIPAGILRSCSLKRRAVSVSGRGSCPAISTIRIRTLLGPETRGQPMPGRRSIEAAIMGFEARRPQDGRHRRHQAAGDWHLPKAQRAKTMAGTARAGTMAPLGEGFGPRRRSAGGRQASAGYLVNAGQETLTVGSRNDPDPAGRARRLCYFFGGGAGGGAGGGTSSPRPPKMSCFQRSKRELAILTRCVFSGPISCAAITLPSGLATPSPLA